MNKFQAYSIEHPQVIALFFGFLCGYAAYNAFRGGMALQFLQGDAARAASEALGG
jgi:hypothetical protein